MTQLPIIFLLGPSGSGKSTLSGWLAEDLQMLHLEIDRWPDGNGIDLEGLRSEWKAFLETRQVDGLATVIRQRGREAGRRGAVLSFPSTLVLDPGLFQAGEGHGIKSFVLYGTAAECLAAFLDRERATGRKLSQEHWIQNNANSYITHSRQEFTHYRLQAFAAGGFRTRGDLVAEVTEKLGLD